MNFTQCQAPIMNFTAALNASITKQLPEWLPITYVRLVLKHPY